MQALSIVPIAVLRHQKRFKVLSLSQILSLSLGLVTAVYIAAKGGGAWAIVIQGFVIHGSMLLFVFLASKFKPKMFLNFKMIKEHLAFGYTVMGANFLELSRDSIRSFVIGKVLGTAILGFYSLAFLFLYLPFRVIHMILGDVVYSYLAPLRDDKELLSAMLLLIVRCLSIAVLPVMGLLAVANQAVFGVILSETWLLSGTLFMLAAPGAALAAIMIVRHTFLQIIGEVKMNFRCGLEILFLQSAVLFIFVWQGIEWAMLGFALSMLLYIPRELVLIKRHLDCDISQIIRSVFPSFLMTIVGAIAYLELISVFSIHTLLSQLFAAFSIGIITLLITTCIQYKTLRIDFKMISDKLDYKATS